MSVNANIGIETWLTNESVTINQIDHIVFDGRHGSNIKNMRSLRRIDAD